MSERMKRPAFMFYPADWRKDPELRVCSIAARGLWIDMIALMHEGEPYGHLVVNGVAVSDVQLARLVGESVSLVRRLLSELESHNVFSRNDSGAIYSRRMVQDEHIRTVRAESGKLGGNPRLKVGAKDKGLVKQTAKQIPTPSVAVADAEKKEPSPQEAVAVIRTTWMTPYCSTWKQQYGGDLPVTVFAPFLAKLRKEHGDPEVLRRWSIYVTRTEGRFASAAKFSQTWGDWEDKAPAPAKRPARVLSAVEML